MTVVFFLKVGVQDCGVSLSFCISVWEYDPRIYASVGDGVKRELESICATKILSLVISELAEFFYFHDVLLGLFGRTRLYLYY